MTVRTCSLEEQRGRVVHGQFLGDLVRPVPRRRCRSSTGSTRSTAPRASCCSASTSTTTRARRPSVAHKLGVTFPVLLDTDKTVSKLYDLSTMPSTVIIDRDGKVRYLHRGYLDRLRGRLRQADPGAAEMRMRRAPATTLVLLGRSAARRLLGLPRSSRSSPGSSPTSASAWPIRSCSLSRDALPDKAFRARARRARGRARRHRRAGRRLWLQLGPRRPLAASARRCSAACSAACSAPAARAPSICPATPPRP